MLIEDLDQVLKFIALPVILCAGCVAGVGGEKADRVVAPVIVQFLAVHHPVILHLVEAQAGLRQFRNKAMENSDLGVVSGLTDFCVQGLDLILGWIERASTILDGITLVWTDLQKNISNYVSK